MYTFVQVGNSKTIGYFWFIHEIASNPLCGGVDEAILRLLACCARGQLPPSAPGRYATVSGRPYVGLIARSSLR